MTDLDSRIKNFDHACFVDGMISGFASTTYNPKFHQWRARESKIEDTDIKSLTRSLTHLLHSPVYKLNTGKSFALNSG